MITGRMCGFCDNAVAEICEIEDADLLSGQIITIDADFFYFGVFEGYEEDPDDGEEDDVSGDERSNLLYFRSKVAC